jgi:hypothetical protein
MMCAQLNTVHANTIASHHHVRTTELATLLQNWWWDGDWEKQSASTWARQPLGTPEPPKMLDSEGWVLC